MKKGFTLIELLVVVLIIGILAAVALPQYTKAVEKSRTAEAMQMLGDIATAEQIYYMSTNGFSQSLEAMDLSFPNVSGAKKDTINTNSYEIVVGVPTTGTSANVVITAKRKDGAYKDQGLYLKVDSAGAVTKGFLASSTDIAALAPQWSNTSATVSANTTASA